LNNTNGADNTAIGAFALWANNADNNTAVGATALGSNTAGVQNTATGATALMSNTTGNNNTAYGFAALDENITGLQNTACGVSALSSNTTGDDNTVIGMLALSDNTTGNSNTAVGYGALAHNTGSSNTGLGNAAGLLATDGDGNVYIGAHMHGVAGEANTTYIRNVYSSQASARIVYVDANNKIGTLSSSRRYKEDVASMDKASEAIFALKPVTFRYKEEIDHARALSFGLIAEEVAEISPDLISRDRDGKPETVRYDAVNAMLLNEFLKAHRTVQEQKAIVAQLKHDFHSKFAEQQKQIEALTAGLQKVSAQIETSKPAPQVVNNP
jgi:hypothetical protein